MTTRQRPGTRADAAGLERELLARLGLTTQANAQEIEAAHDELVRFLDSAPYDLRSWAQREIAAADEAYALLSDPTADLSVAACSAPAGPGEPPAAAHLTRPAADDEIEELDDEPPVPRKARGTARQQRRAASGGAGQDRRGAWSRLSRRLGLTVAVVIGAVAIAVAGYNLGAPQVPGFTGTPAPQTSAAAQIDQAKVVDFMKKIQANPQDTAALQELGDLFFRAGEYDVAAGWMEKVLAIDPRNVTARLALGAARFNQGRPADAEMQWRQVLVLDPKNIEAHYDLGFMYLNQSPPDVANVKAEWGRVIEIAPDSDVAKTIAVHLKSLEDSLSPDASVGSGPSRSSGATPSATPGAASPGTSGN